MWLRGLRRYLSLPRSERRLFHRALAELARTRLGLTFLPYAAIQRRLLAPATPAPSASAFTNTREVLLAVRRASRLVPRATCLTQAIAARALLADAGVAATLRLGVARGEQGFEAHAWLERDGVVLIGGDRGVDQYAKLPLDRHTV